jgi:hypothetical protein
VPESIECLRASLKARSVTPLRPYAHDRLHSLVWPWKLKEAAEASIIRELNPKVAVIDAASKLNLGDQINGKMIEGFSTNPLPPKRLEADSSSHRGQFTEASDFVYCYVHYTYYQLTAPPRLLLLTMGLV